MKPRQAKGNIKIGLAKNDKMEGEAQGFLTYAFYLNSLCPVASVLFVLDFIQHLQYNDTNELY